MTDEDRFDRRRRKRRRSRFLRLAIAATALVAIGTVVGLLLSSNGPQVNVVFGQPLTPAGQDAYVDVAKTGDVHEDLGGAETETPPPEAAVPVDEAADLLDANQHAAEAGTIGPDHPLTLAAREPVDQTRLLPRNYSSRRGARPALLVVHSTESSNITGLQDVLAIVAWFSNPRASASSNYTTDAEGNTIRLVRETDKAWTQAFFNPWAISDELIGRASQTSWPEPQLRATARLFAAASAKWGIPIRPARVSGCTIVRSGILQHNDLGACGGGHHDAGPAFPIKRFIAMTAEYAAGGFRPRTAPTIRCPAKGLQRALNRNGARPRLTVDGQVGPKTTAALKRFQRAHHLPATGRVGRRAALALGGCS